MKIMIAAILLLVGLSVSGCMESHFEDDLRGVPVTNNPTLFPSSAQTAQGPGIGN